MSFFAIQNFRFGLDTRRSEYTSQPGTLLTLDNAHVNEGGEIEKRGAFSRATGLTGTFGLVAGASSLYVFGSVATPGGFPLTLFGQTVNYIRCRHPDLSTAMTKIVSGRTFAGLPFVIAQFADGNNYPYYNGTLVSDYTSGLILASLNTDTKIGTAFAGLINALSPSYKATDHVNGTVDTFNSANAQGTGYLASVVLGSTNTGTGALSSTFTSAGTPAVSLGAAVAQFQIHAGTASPAVNQIQSVKVFGLPTTTVSRARTGTTVTLVVASTAGMTTADLIRVTGLSVASFNVASAAVTVVNATTLTYTVATSGTVVTTADTGGVVIDLSVGVEILNSAVDWVTDNAHTAEAVAAQINSYTSTPDYLASSSGSVVQVFTNSALAAAFNSLVIQVTVLGNVCIGDCVFSVAASTTGNTPIAPVFTHIFVNGNDIAGTNSETITDLPSAIKDEVDWINSQSGTTGIVAWSSYAATGGNIMRLAKKVTRSDDSPISVNITPVSGYGITTGSSAPLVASVSIGILADAQSSAFGRSVNFGPNLLQPRTLCVPSGGVPPYTHNWQTLNSTSNPDGISIAFINSVKSGAPYFNLTPVSAIGGGQFVDVVTDSAGNVSTSNPITILFT